MYDEDLLRVVVKGHTLGPAIAIVASWAAVGAWLYESGSLAEEGMLLYLATGPVVFLGAAVAVAIRWVVHADPDFIEVVTEPFPLPLGGWSLPREAVAFVSIEEREHSDENTWSFGYKTRTTWWGDRRQLSWAVVLTDRQGRHWDVANGFHSGDAAKELADQIRRVMRL